MKATKGRMKWSGIVLAVIGVVASRKAPQVGLSLAVTGIVFTYVGYKLDQINIDPIDPNFSKVPVPSFPNLPAIRPVRNTGLTISVAQAIDAVIANEEKAIGLLTALRTALDRSDEAAKAGDEGAEKRQLNAARDFAKRVAEVFKQSAPLRSTLATKWKGPGLVSSISRKDALQTRENIIINGFSSPILDALKTLVVDKTDRDILLHQLIIELANLPVRSLQTGVRDLLRDAKLRAAEGRLIRSFEQFSRTGT